MKLLLINAGINQDLREKYRNEPLGVLYLAASAMEAGWDVKFKDFDVEPYSEQILSSLLEEYCPDVVGISSRSSTFPWAERMGDFIHRINPSIPLLIGGQHASAAPDSVLKAAPYFYVFRGEAEESLIAFLRLLEAGEGKVSHESLVKLKGISFIHGDETVHLPDTELINDLDSIPWPARELAPFHRYIYHFANESSFNLMSSRGCPYKCYFCDKSISRHGQRMRSAESVADEVCHCIKAMGRKAVFFCDDLFLGDKKRIDRIFEILRERKISIVWQCPARVDSIDEEFIIKLKSYGCASLTFGVESGDEESLKKMGKGISLEKSKNALQLCKKHEIRAKSNFVIGFPWDTNVSIRNTIDFAKELDTWDETDFYLATPYASTPFYKDCLKLGLLETLPDPELCNQFNAIVPTLHLSIDEMNEWLLRAYSELFVHQLENLLGLKPDDYSSDEDAELMHETLNESCQQLYTFLNKMIFMFREIPRFGNMTTSAVLKEICQRSGAQLNSNDNTFKKTAFDKLMLKTAVKMQTVKYQQEISRLKDELIQLQKSGLFLLGNYLAQIWQEKSRTSGRLLLFGGGLHSRWLLKILIDKKLSLPFCILDDNPADGSIFGIPVLKANTFSPEPKDIIVLSTDIYQDLFRKRCKELYRASAVWDLYEKIPHSIYPKEEIESME